MKLGWLCCKENNDASEVWIKAGAVLKMAVRIEAVGQCSRDNAAGIMRPDDVVVTIHR